MNAPVYRKLLGVFRNPGIRRELRNLDPDRDHQRIVHLMTVYEFPFDMVRALELALFHTYASPSVSGLLDRTGEFQQRGQQRYDDTSMLISHFMQAGYNSPMGERAIGHMNRIHGHYPIPNEDFLFVLATFIFYPIDWMRRYGWRAFTPGEAQALFRFFRETGLRMNLHDVPDSLEAFAAFTDAYEARHFRFTESNRHIADATVRIVEGWFPRFLRPLVQPVFAALISEKLRLAFGYKKPARWFCALTEGALWLRKWPLRWLTFEPYPKVVAMTHYRSYPAGNPEPEALGPEGLVRRMQGTGGGHHD